jgi:RNA polymerase sigma factor (sigma-70 family)
MTGETTGAAPPGELILPGVERAAPLVFEAFYATEVRAVTSLAYALTGSWTVAEDLTQEAFARAFRDWQRVAAFERPDSWIRTVTANLATSRLRRLAAEARAVGRLRQRREPAEALPEDVESFLSALRRLPRRQAQAAALRYVDDLPIAEIAAVMGCATGTAKAHLHAARRRLLAELHLDQEDDR